MKLCNSMANHPGCVPPSPNNGLDRLQQPQDPERDEAGLEKWTDGLFPLVFILILLPLFHSNFYVSKFTFVSIIYKSRNQKWDIESLGLYCFHKHLRWLTEEKCLQCSFIELEMFGVFLCVISEVRNAHTGARRQLYSVFGYFTQMFFIIAFFF